MTTITIDRALLEQALEALEQSRVFVTTREKIKHPEGTDWYNERISALRTELAKPVDASYTAMQLAAMVLSDCGISTNHTALHERVAARISRHEVDLFDRLKKLAKPPTPAWHDAPTCDGLWLCNEGDDNPYRWTTHRVKFPLSPLLVGEDERWYGPIQQEGGKP